MIDPTGLCACVLVLDFRGEHPLLLSVARKDDHNDWNLPGGKLDPNTDTNLVGTAARELHEETWIISGPLDFTPVFTKDDGHGFLATTFLRPRMESDPSTFGPIEGEAPVKWVPLLEICASNSSFASYNYALLEALGLLRFPLGMKVDDLDLCYHP